MILVLRVYAIYDRNQYLLWTLLGFLAGQIITEVAIMGPIAARMDSKQTDGTFGHYSLIE